MLAKSLPILYTNFVMKLILASNSPRRKQILLENGFEFSVLVADYLEKDIERHPVDTAKDNALGKALAVYDSLKDKNAVVLGADTVVYLDQKLLGKPNSPNQAKQMLKSLSGKTHVVVTGFAIITKNERIVGASESKVTFNELTDKIIDDYVLTGSPLDKAGAYGIQDNNGIVKSFTGELNNIIGLPINDIAPILNKLLK